MTDLTALADQRLDVAAQRLSAVWARTTGLPTSALCAVLLAVAGASSLAEVAHGLPVAGGVGLVVVAFYSRVLLDIQRHRQRRTNGVAPIELVAMQSAARPSRLMWTALTVFSAVALPDVLKVTVAVRSAAFALAMYVVWHDPDTDGGLAQRARNLLQRHGPAAATASS